MLEKNPKRTEYRLSDGTLVPSVTTMLGVIDKPALHNYFYECGKLNTGYPPPSEGTAGVGRIAHYLIACWLKQEPEAEVSTEYEAEHIQLARNIYEKFMEWYCAEFNFPVKLLLVEEPLVHEVLRYGGTPDLLLRDAKGRLKLLDFKSSNWIFDEYFFQLAGYRELIKYNFGFPEEEIDLICINVTKKLNINVAYLTEKEDDKAYSVFLAALKLYKTINAFNHVKNNENKRSKNRKEHPAPETES